VDLSGRPPQHDEASFVAGPLLQAMRSGRVLFINELNRMPESVQNVLLPALGERLIQVPHIGEVRAADGFQVEATQNPVEYVATGHLSEALGDRADAKRFESFQGIDDQLFVVGGDGAEAAVRKQAARSDQALVAVVTEACVKVCVRARSSASWPSWASRA
jgi:MoxR-like ATPase